MASQLELIRNFLGMKRIAVVGVSRKPTDFTRKLWEEFRARGCDAIPIHIHQESINHVRCYPTLSEIPNPVEGALILTSKSQTLAILQECISNKITLVWLYGVRGDRDVSPAALQYCRDNDINVITGFCPFMFFPESAFFHRFHGFCWKLVGYFPQ
jgi:predicted CoA-binding protein